jgi:hypothetical protein
MNRSFKSMLFAAAAVVALGALGTAAPALAAGTGANTTAPGVVNVNVGGMGGNVTITTQAPYVNDQLQLVAPGAFSVNQSNRFASVGQWTGDGNDIDRIAAFTGTGTINASSSYLSTDAWSVANAALTATVSATADGGLQQNLSFDQNNGGVYTQSQWSKQRSMQLSAGGTYTIGVSNIGASLAPSLGSMPVGAQPAYNFSIDTSATSGASNLLFSPTLATTGFQALSNNADHSQYTGMSTNFQLDYSDSPVVNVNGHTVINGTVNITEIPGTVVGSGTIH